MYPRLKTRIFFPFTYVHLTVLLLLNLVLNLTLSLLLIMSSHLHASTSDSFIDYWHYTNVFDWLKNGVVLSRLFQSCDFELNIDIILCLAGFGNLRGNIEMWDVTGSRRLISNTQAPDTTEFEWSPDGLHFITATTTPRLRIGNGYVHSLPEMCGLPTRQSTDLDPQYFLCGHGLMWILFPDKICRRGPCSVMSLFFYNKN